MPPVDTPQVDAPHLTRRLWTPAGLLGLLMLALTVLPMASCGPGSNSRIVPAKLFIEMASPSDSGPPLSVPERIGKFFGGIPVLFLFTWPYWTAGPAALPWLLSAKRLQGQRRQQLVLWLWRTSILSLILGTGAIGFAAEDLRGTSLIVVGGIALLVWLASSPATNRASQWFWQWMLLRHSRQRWRTRIDPLVGGCWSLAIQCFLSVAPLAWHGPSLLIGGMLAAGVNVALGVVLLATARQFKQDCRRTPRLSIQDLLIAVTISAIFMAMFWTRH